MNSNHQLVEAVKSNNIEKAKAILSDHQVSGSTTIVNDDYAGHNLLHFATINNCIEVNEIKFLVHILALELILFF